MIIISKTLSTSVLSIIFTMAISFTVYMPVSLAIPKTFHTVDLKIRGEQPECISIHEDARFPKFSNTQSLKGGEYNDVITAPISKGGINRISAFPYHIKEIIGDKSKYEFLSSDDRSNIFIVPKVKLGDKLELSVITSNGSIHDLSLEVQKDTAPAIHLKALKENHSRHSLYNKANEPNQVLKMISHMSSDHHGAYYVKNTNRNIINNLGLRIRQTQVWRFGNLVGAIINVRNLSHNTKSLTEDDFKSLFKGTKAISIVGSNILPSWTNSKLLVVAEDIK